MDVKKYIKVTPKGETRAHVVLTANKPFYEKNGATIEAPTEDEILKAFPELKNDYPGPYQPSKKEIEGVVNRIKEQDEQILSLIAGREVDADQIAKFKSEIQEVSELYAKLNAQYKALSALNASQSNQIVLANETIEKLKAAKK